MPESQLQAHLHCLGNGDWVEFIGSFLRGALGLLKYLLAPLPTHCFSESLHELWEMLPPTLGLGTAQGIQRA